MKKNYSIFVFAIFALLTILFVYFVAVDNLRKNSIYKQQKYHKNEKGFKFCSSNFKKYAEVYGIYLPFFVDKRFRIVVGGCVKNCGKWLNNVFENILKLNLNLIKKSHFAITDLVLAYDRSEDKTLEILNSFKSFVENNNLDIKVKILSNENLDYYETSPIPSDRTKNISNARNIVLKEILLADNEDASFNKIKYLFWMDFDDVCASPFNDVSLVGKILSLHEEEEDENNKWDCATFYNDNYYDYWALSFDEYTYSCWHWTNPVEIVGLMKNALDDKMSYLDGDCQSIRVHSAFGGFAIYDFTKLKELYKNSELVLYDPNFNLEMQTIDSLLRLTSKTTKAFPLHPSLKHDDCEHKNFNIKNKLNVCLYKGKLFSPYVGEHKLHENVKPNCEITVTDKPPIIWCKGILSSPAVAAKKRVAICFWGLCRSSLITHKTIQTNLYDQIRKLNFEYKIFLHTNTLGKSVKYSNKWSGDYNVQNFDENWRLHNPDKFEIESEKIFETFDFNSYKTNQDYYDSGYREVENIIKALYSLKRVTELVEDDVKTNGKAFDYVVFCRPDLQIMKPIPFEDVFKQVNFSTIVTPKTNQYPVNDRFAISTYENGLTYGKRFDKVLEYSKKTIFHPETFLYLWMKKNEINLNPTEQIVSYIVRTNGNFDQNFDSEGNKKLSVHTTIKNHSAEGQTMESSEAFVFAEQIFI